MNQTNQKKPVRHKQWQLLLFAVSAAAAVGLDQWTKAAAVAALKDRPPFVLISGIFELYYSENRGAAFGIMQGKQGLFLVITAVVVLGAVITLIRMPGEKKYGPLTVCLSLLVSGAVGNLIDRLSQGYVVDFLYFKLIDFPIFNVADCYVVTATCLLIFLSLFFYSEEELSFLSLKK